MRAMAIEEFGGADQVREMDLPQPKLAPDGVLIAVRAAGLNPVDWKIRNGKNEPAFPHVFPLILGWDAAGMVEKVGPAVTRFGPGDEVFTYARKHFIGEGTYAEYVSVPESFVAAKPDSLDFAHAAALPLAALTARQALIGAAGLREGETVLVQAAAGGVGGFAVQIAAALGARPIGTARAQKHDHVRSLGAEEVIDYTSEDFVAASREWSDGGVDVVFDTVGGEALERGIDALRDGGRLVAITEPPQGERFQERGVRSMYVYVRPGGEELATLGAMAEEGTLRVHLEEVFPLGDAAQALERLEEGRVTGKLALAVE